MGICTELTRELETEMEIEMGVATVDNNDFVETAGLDTLDTEVFMVTGCGLTHFGGISAASLAFLVRVCLYGPMMCLTGRRIFWGIVTADDKSTIGQEDNSVSVHDGIMGR